MIKDVYDLTDDKRAEHEQKYGGFNDLPPNWHEISAEDFAQSAFFQYSPDIVEHRQMYPANGGKMINTTLYFFFDGSGYAIVNNYWDKTIKYYKFYLCDHKYEELSPDEARALGHSHFGMCYHVIRCTKCGHIRAYDSSG